jgi:hypothetical protein
MARLFTLEEANELLPQVRPLVEAMVRARGKLATAEEAHDYLRRSVAGNGGHLDPEQIRDTREAVEQLSEQLGRTLAALGELGVLVKDAASGLVDFPAERAGEVILLCWQLGEERVAFWHGTDDGFAGRQPI